jgi:predicted nucleotidyltransferase
MTNDPPFDPNALREQLLSIALPYAESLKSRPGLVGILLYGSLARGGLSPFSDIDLAVLYEGEPPHQIEHRVVEGKKLDVIAYPLECVTGLLDPLPRSMDVGPPFFSRAFESLLRSGNDAILYDPTGELLRVKTRLNEAVSFDALKRASLSNGYLHFYCPNIQQARSLLEQGDAPGALDKAKWCGWALGLLIRDATLLKETREAAERLGIPAFADKSDELAMMSAPPREAIEAGWAAQQALWDHSLATAMEPIREKLRSEGVEEPDQLEIAGNYDLFWPGEYLTELGRTQGEVSYGLRRCRYDLDQGRSAAALQYLSGNGGSPYARTRWERLSVALKATGYDCSSLIASMLDSPEFARLGEHADRAMKALAKKEATPEAAQRALSLTEEMEQLLVHVVSFMSPEEWAEWQGPPKPEATGA